MDALRELRFAARNLVRRKAFAATVIATLAVGIAGTTVVFSLVSGALLRLPPFPDPERLVLAYRQADLGGGEPRLTRWSFPRYMELRRTAKSFDGLAAFGRAELNITTQGDPALVAAETVSAEYFAVLQARPTLGRAFRADEDSIPGANPVAVIGYDLWVRQFGADSGMIGRSIRINGEVLTVIGVMPRGFGGLTGQAELWVPKAMAPTLIYPEHLTTDQNFISVVGRLRPGVTIEAAGAEVGALGTSIAAALPDQDEPSARWSASLVPLAQARVDPGNQRALRLLLAAVAFLLLLACANVAGLGLAETVARRKEITVRLALGAGRGRVTAQLLTESAVLGAVAGSLGTLLAAYLVQIISLPVPVPGPGNMYGAIANFATATIDGRVLGFAVLASVAAILVSGLIPAVTAGRADLALELRDRGGLGGRRTGRTQAGLVIVEIALALVLAVGGALLFESLRRLQTVPVGIDPEQVLSFRIQPSDVRYPSEQAPELLDRVLAAVKRVPGVRSATVDGCAPLGTSCARSTLFIVGQSDPGSEGPSINRHYVGSEHFVTLGIPVIAGRSFTDQDRPGRPDVAIINQTAARRFFPGIDPLGQRIWFGGGSRFNQPDSSATIVGVVGDVPYGSLERGPVASVYTPYRQFSYAGRTVLVRVDGDPMAKVSAIRTAVGGVDELPIFEVRRLSEQLGDSWARTRFVAQLMGAFALVALLLAIGGVYGMVSHSVNQRTQELGVRSALGATVGDMVRLVMGQGVSLAVWGIGLGLVAVLVLGRTVGALLYGVRAANPVVLGMVSLGLVGAAGLASYLPARRAARVDPLVSLRME